MRRVLPALACLLTACTLGEPLGDDWYELDQPARDARAVEALEDLFANGVDGGGGKVKDRVVIACDLEGITYRAADTKAESKLRWADVEAVENTPHNDLPARPETLFLYVKQGSPSQKGAGDLVRPPLASTGLVSPYVKLRSRPRWSRNKLLAALNQVRRSVALKKKTEPPPPAENEPEPAPTPPPELEPLEDPVEAKLRKLKKWHEEGLIDDDEYEAKRKELLEDY